MPSLDAPLPGSMGRCRRGAALSRFEPAETGSDWFANESLQIEFA
jgi:hypothetical protein